MLVSHIQQTMHIRGIDWQGRDYIINPSSHLQGWAWREQNRNLRHSECEIIWSKNISHPPPPLINVHQDTPQKYPTFTSFKATPKLWFYCSSLIISSFNSQFTLRSCHTLPLLFSILEHISPPPMLRDPWTQCVQMITEMAEITVDSVYTDYSCYNCQWHHTGWGARPTPCYHPSSHQPQCIIISSCNHIVLSSCNLITVSFYSMLTTHI